MPNAVLETELGVFYAERADGRSGGHCAYHEVDNGSSKDPREAPPLSSTEALRAASIIWNESRALFERHKAEWQIFSRVGSTQANFSEIPPDVWRHYSVIDWGRGVATTNSDGRRPRAVRAYNDPRPPVVAFAEIVVRAVF